MNNLNLIAVLPVLPRLWLPLILLIFIVFLVLILKISIKPIVKIENYTLTYFCGGFYILFYFLFFFILRILQLGKTFDLKNFVKKFFGFFINFQESSFFIQFIYIGGVIILILLWLIIFFKIRKILRFQLWKLYFFKANIERLTVCSTETVAKFHKTRDKYKRFSFFTLGKKVTRYLNKILFYVNKKEFNIVNTTGPTQILRFFPLLILFFIFILECYNYNFVLHYTLYYLPIYMVFNIWYLISLVLDKEVFTIDQILIERAYGEPKILYVNLTELEEKLLETYIQEYYNFDKLFDIGVYESCSTDYDIVHPICYHRRFVLTSNSEISKDTMIYLNKNKIIWKYFEPCEITKKNGKNFVKDDVDGDEDN